MDPKDLLERAVRGDLDAMQEALTQHKRGAYSIEESSRLREEASGYVRQWSEAVSTLKTRSAATPRFVRRQGFALWHLQNLTKGGKTLCNNAVFGDGVVFSEEIPKEVWVQRALRNGEIDQLVGLCKSCLRRMNGINPKAWKKLKTELLQEFTEPKR